MWAFFHLNVYSQVDNRYMEHLGYIQKKMKTNVVKLVEISTVGKHHYTVGLLRGCMSTTIICVYKYTHTDRYINAKYQTHKCNIL